MYKLTITAIAAFAVALAGTAAVQENHCQEAGTGPLLTRSAFAHGYRHGYEAGYHEGNIDINMARRARTQFKQFKGLPLGYAPGFGSKKSFEFGFALGLKAGYSDGYAGRSFRAVNDLRLAAESLNSNPAPSDPENSSFDHGMTLGYQDGFAGAHARAKDSAMDAVDLQSVQCNFHPRKKQDEAAQSSYCDGYRRGFVLGHDDGLALGPGEGLLEASK
jgi:flagellar biosynthesis/type III secretory pathway protein FliH